MPIDADHIPAQSHWSEPLPRLAGVAVVVEAVADPVAATATDTGPRQNPRCRFGISSVPTGPIPAPTRFDAMS
jgi:hypothetical protein